MIIRSQCKEIIVNMDCASEIYIAEEEKGVRIDTPTSVLGRYSTKAKAIKVLDMICDFYTEHLEELKCDEPPFVRAFFTMSQDEEVEV